MFRVAMGYLSQDVGSARSSSFTNETSQITLVWSVSTVIITAINCTNYKM